MPSVLEELYYGNVCPDVKYYQQDSPFVEAARLKNVNLEKLIASLNDTEKEIFDKYCDAQSDIEGISRYANFTYGFKLGVLLMVETFMGRGEITGEETIY